MIHFTAKQRNRLHYELLAAKQSRRLTTRKMTKVMTVDIVIFYGAELNLMTHSQSER